MGFESTSEMETKEFCGAAWPSKVLKGKRGNPYCPLNAPKIPGVRERAVERERTRPANLKTSVMACVCCAAIAALHLSRGNGIHGVNPTNAEHAIKRFAKYRRQANGCFTERSLQEYLVLAYWQACSKPASSTTSTFSNSCFRERQRDDVGRWKGYLDWRGSGRRRREKCG
jgi:hypothetical protein